MIIMCYYISKHRRHIMELYIDSSDVKEIKNLMELVTVSGVTTNPTILTRSGKEPEEVLKEIIDLLDEDMKLFAQVIATDYDGIMEEARKIVQLRPKNMYVKIPVTHEGLKAIKQCKKEGIPTLATAIYSSNQAMMAAMNGADYLAPYVNRMCNYGDGIQDVKDLIEMLRVSGLPTKIVAASFKNALQAHELMKAGIQAETLPVDVIYSLMDHPATTIAVGEFTVNWQRAYHRNGFFK